MPDYGSMVSFTIFLGEVALIATFSLHALRRGERYDAAEPRNDARLEEASQEPPESSPVKYSIEDSQLFEMVAHANDGIVANIDVLNLGAIGVVALPAVFEVFAIDKIGELGIFGLLALGSLGSSIVFGLRAFNWGDSRDRGVQDSIDPRRFLIYYAQAGDRAIPDTIRSIIASADTNASIRAAKRALTRWAIGLFVVGFVLLGAGKLAKDTKTNNLGAPDSLEITCTVKMGAENGVHVIKCR